MYLEKLEIQGFKSFARQTELVFNRDLTAIVGPNGSGKSNIADAVRWVLGEQSAKTLRGKKSEDVIFAGSDKKGRLGLAQVDLYLNNKDGLANIDYEQVVVSRRVDRKGESEYLINNNKVRLLDVQLLLAQANFGQKTYSVIGQGMIDSILVSSAAERKEFFDEATGVRQFQIKKEQASNKVEHSKVNLEQTNQILVELEPRLRSLTRQVKKLEKREKIEQELKELQNNYYSFLVNNLDKDLNKTKDRFRVLQKEVSDLNQQLVDLQTKLEGHEQSDSRQTVFQNLQSKLSQAQIKLNTLIKERTILEGKADIKLLSSGQADLVWLKTRRQDLNNEIDKAKLSLEQAQNNLKDKQQALKILETKQDAVLSEFKDLEKRLQADKLELSISDLSKEVARIFKKQQDLEIALLSLEDLADLPAVKSACQQVTKDTKIFWEKIKQNMVDKQLDWKLEFNKLLTSKDTLVEEVNTAKTETALLEKEIEQTQQQLDKEQEELKKTEANLKSASGQATDNESKKQVDELSAKISEQEKEVKKIEQEVQSFNLQEEEKKSSLVTAQKKFRKLQHDFNLKNNDLSEVKVSLARLETKKEDLEKEISEEVDNLQIVAVKEIDLEASRSKIHNLKNQMGVIGSIDEVVVQEHQEVNERYQFLKQQTGDLDAAIGHLEKVIKDLDDAISSQFDQSFKNINQLFSKYFKKLFDGGKAQLILDIKEVPIDKQAVVEEEDDEEVEEKEKKPVAMKKQYGIEIMATPPGKRLSSINMLSGGEKALTSIALVCSIIANNPSPFVVLDEVDAALDEANSIRFAEILQKLSDRTQFITITHNRATMHQAKIIYGVTMGDDGISNLLSMNFEEADEIAA